jgi:molybdopterin-guanine dinucleotide biosynthesis protein A
MTVDRGGRGAAERATHEGLCGVVVCGGASRRFGSDKALALVDGTTLLERTLGVLEQRCNHVFAATGVAPRYTAILAARAQVVLDRAPDIGPLAGLEAALAAAARVTGATHLLAVACDLPNLDTATLDRLVERAQASDAHAVLWRDEGGEHPLLACYRVDVLPAVTAAIARCERRLVAFHGAPLQEVNGSPLDSRVRVAHVDRESASASAPDPAANANSPHELAGASPAPRPTAARP